MAADPTAMGPSSDLSSSPVQGKHVMGRLNGKVALGEATQLSSSNAPD